MNNSEEIKNFANSIILAGQHFQGYYELQDWALAELKELDGKLWSLLETIEDEDEAYVLPEPPHVG